MLSSKNNFTIVIVTFKSEKVIETCLNSIDQKYTIIVVENSSNVNFKKFMYNSISYNPHIVFISKPNIANRWFSDLFSWLDNCEKIIGFKKLKGYEKRLYAYLAERYLSFWFKKYTNSIDWPLITVDIENI